MVLHTAENEWYEGLLAPESDVSAKMAKLGGIEYIERWLDDEWRNLVWSNECEIFLASLGAEFFLAKQTVNRSLAYCSNYRSVYEDSAPRPRCGDFKHLEKLSKAIKYFWGRERVVRLWWFSPKMFLFVYIPTNNFRSSLQSNFSHKSRQRVSQATFAKRRESGAADRIFV